MDSPKSWQLTAFAEMLDSHFTTVNQWFKSLEAKGIHYVLRAPDGTKVYFEEDLKIGQFIKAKRSDKKQVWSLDGIFAQLENEPDLELRPFPPDYKSSETDLSTEVMGLFKREFSNLLEQIDNKQQAFEQRILYLQNDNEKYRIEERQKRITDMITEKRINTLLEIEALEEWSKLPESERLIKVGLFKRVEDSVKREIFIKKYVFDNYSEKLKKEMEIEDKNNQYDTNSD